MDKELEIEIGKLALTQLKEQAYYSKSNSEFEEINLKRIQVANHLFNTHSVSVPELWIGTDGKPVTNANA